MSRKFQSDMCRQGALTILPLIPTYFNVQMSIALNELFNDMTK
jgi:hypothetical protein